MTTELFDAVSARLKAILTAPAALGLEAAVIACHTPRQAALLRQAVEWGAEGFKARAAEWRQHAGGLDPRRPAEAVLPMLTQVPTPPEPGKASMPTATETSAGAAKTDNGVAAPPAEPVDNRVAPVPTQVPATEPTPGTNGVADHPTPEAPLPVAVPPEPPPEPA